MERKVYIRPLQKIEKGYSLDWVWVSFSNPTRDEMRDHRQRSDVHRTTDCPQRWFKMRYRVLVRGVGDYFCSSEYRSLTKKRVSSGCPLEHLLTSFNLMPVIEKQSIILISRGELEVAKKKNSDFMRQCVTWCCEGDAFKMHTSAADDITGMG
jgi:hypothetical protein